MCPKLKVDINYPSPQTVFMTVEYVFGAYKHLCQNVRIVYQYTRYTFYTVLMVVLWYWCLYLRYSLPVWPAWHLMCPSYISWTHLSRFFMIYISLPFFFKYTKIKCILPCKDDNIDVFTLSGWIPLIFTVPVMYYTLM